MRVRADLRWCHRFAWLACVGAGLGACSGGHESSSATSSTSSVVATSMTSSSNSVVLDTIVTIPAPALPAATDDITSTDMLAGWPAPPSAPPSLSVAPYLLPTGPVDGVKVVELSTITFPAETPYGAYTQEFVLQGGALYAVVRTTTETIVPVGSSPIAVQGWDSAWMLAGADTATVVLSEPSGSVEIRVSGNESAADVAMSLAWTMARRDDGAVGWEVGASTNETDSQATMIDSITPLSEGWEGPWVRRTATWVGSDSGPIVELWITVGQPLLADPRVAVLPQVTGDISGDTAISQVILDRGSLVAWSPAKDVTVTVLTRGTVSETLEFARMIAAVTEAEWNAAGRVVPPETEFGCDYFVDPC